MTVSNNNVDSLEGRVVDVRTSEMVCASTFPKDVCAHCFFAGGNQEYDSRGPSRRVTSAGRGFKVEVHQDQAHRDDGGRSGFGAQPRGRGRGRGSGFDGTSQHQYSVGGSFGSGADGGKPYSLDQVRVFKPD